MKIHIPSPCHENWNAMTANEKGRFYGSCQKTVVDFTNFSAKDIQNYFTKHYGQKVCGRFKNEQLATINIEIPSAVFNYIPASRKFAFALLIVFGTTLFSCTDNNGNSATIGKIEVVDSLQIDSLSKTKVEQITTDDKPSPAQYHVTQGEVALPEPKELMGDTIASSITMGKVKTTKKLPKVDSPLLEKTVLHTMGMIAPDYKIDTILRSK
jgi:hypothetical protein